MIGKQIWDITDTELQLSKLTDKIDKSKNIAIFWHDNADGDCVWSMLGFGKILENIGKMVSYHTSFDVPNSFDRVKWINKISTEFDFKSKDMIVLVDCNNFGRISKFYHMKPDYFDTTNNIVIIDHHLYDKTVWNINLIDTTSSSCCELIREISKYIFEDKLIDKDIANYLCLGTLTDTGTFKHEKDTIRTFENVIEMVKKWADKRYLVNNLDKISYKEAVYMWEFLSRYKMRWDIWYTYYTEQDLKDYGIESWKTWQSIIKRIDDVPISIVFGCKNNKYWWSMRTKSDDINLSDIASELWWWGHQKAAWFEMDINGDFQDWIEKTVDDINNMIDMYKL